ncbi:APC family permease [Pontibacter indicus]|uniref:Amino acid/polyamine/organocation transporter, APC superfamily n=1 Tax=Pontibacter indicus TaxID=1317125 RepID=A0A1R3X4V8_9BACT|nr:APC family permease [Pontibacter indicus]SIT85786.1 amino acid/polyamine/organocation transporter, APC superfamily [Pontibacter indicus]
MQENPVSKHHDLLRVLTLKDAVGVGLGAIIGAGIFVVTGVAAGLAGPAFLVGLLFAGIIAGFNALSSAQLAAVYPNSGGTYEYGYRLLSPTLGFSAGWMFLISKLSAAGVVAIGFGSYFYQLIPVFPPLTLSVLAVLVLTLANYFGIKKAGMLNLFIVSVTLISLLYLVFSGIPAVRQENFQPFAPFGMAGIAEAAALLFFAFTGYARIATLAEEVREPHKTIPRAVIITIVSAIVLYAAVSLVAVGVIGTERMAISKSPLQVVADALHTPAIQTVITIGASTAMLGVLLSQILGISRMMLAMGRRHDLPPVFERVHPWFRVPHVGILLTGSIILLLTLAGSFEFILRSASFTILLYYSITNIAALKQSNSEQLYGKAIPVLGLVGCLAMSVSLPLQVILSGLGLLVIGFALRFLFQKVYSN